MIEIRNIRVLFQKSTLLMLLIRSSMILGLSITQSIVFVFPRVSVPVELISKPFNFEEG